MYEVLYVSENSKSLPVDSVVWFNGITDMQQIERIFITIAEIFHYYTIIFKVLTCWDMTENKNSVY